MRKRLTLEQVFESHAVWYIDEFIKKNGTKKFFFFTYFSFTVNRLSSVTEIPQFHGRMQKYRDPPPPNYQNFENNKL